MLPVVALVGRWLGITRFIHTLASSHGTSNGHYGTRKGNAVDGNDAIRSFCTVQAGLDQERKANRFAPQGSTPSIFIYEQRSWEAEDGYVTEGDYDIRGPADNKSGESILLQEIPPEESKPHEPHRPS